MEKKNSNLSSIRVISEIGDQSSASRVVYPVRNAAERERDIMRNVRILQEESSSAGANLAEMATCQSRGLPRRLLRRTFFKVAWSMCFHQFFQSQEPKAPQ